MDKKFIKGFHKVGDGAIVCFKDSRNGLKIEERSATIVGITDRAWRVRIIGETRFRSFTQYGTTWGKTPAICEALGYSVTAQAFKKGI